MTILKVQFNDEIRRVTIEDDCTLTELTSKVRYMFPQLRSFTMCYMDSGEWMEINSNEDLLSGIAASKKSLPPVFRVSVKVAESTPNILIPVVTPTLLSELEKEEITQTVSPVDATNESTTEEQQPTIITPPVSIETVNPVTSTSTTTTTTDISTVDKCSYCTLESTYKCINCYNFSVCGNCEAQKLHTSTHLLVKMNKPLDQLPLKQQLIFTQHIEGPESDKSAAKVQSKSIRRAMREASLRRKEDRALRKERAQRRISLRKGSKSSKKSSTPSVPTLALPLSPVIGSVVDATPSISCDTAVIEVAPVIEEETTPVVPLVATDSPPQKAVEDISIDMKLIDELLESPKENDEERIEEAELSEDDFVEQVDEATPEGNWNIMNLFGGWRNNNEETQETTINVNDYRIQGIAFQNKLDQLEAMGFTDRPRNMILLAKNLANLERTVEDLTA